MMKEHISESDVGSWEYYLRCHWIQEMLKDTNHYAIHHQTSKYHQLVELRSMVILDGQVILCLLGGLCRSGFSSWKYKQQTWWKMPSNKIGYTKP